MARKIRKGRHGRTMIEVEAIVNDESNREYDTLTPWERVRYDRFRRRHPERSTDGTTQDAPDGGSGETA